MPKPTPRVTLLTDFGTVDGYVGALKATIATTLPHAHIDDVAHDVPPGDIETAAWALGAYWKRYPEGTVHLVVVDPGVGTKRDALAIEADGRFLVGPDNGVLSWALREASRTDAMRSIDRPHDDEISATFHGRDVFAPAAARLAAGEGITSLGPRVGGIVRLPWPEPVHRADGIDGVVIHVDRYGNLITNLPGGQATSDIVVKVGVTQVDVRRTYGDALPGELVAHVGARGLLEIAVRDGRAAERLGGKGHVVSLRAPR
ncbi:MAG TPA: SAM-dependent chlorinase/fluorinase [Longimicrobiales bacterium]|nr:SAM-dependent chlorinase/fluorinase [Longimicrobiales bacterium]